MKLDEFFSLPPGIAIRLLFEQLDAATREAVLAQSAPKPPLPPKFDQAIFRSGGIQWASETDLEGLRFWHSKALQPPSDPKYAESNRKRAESLARWIAWREWFPDATWSGERDRKHGVARGPTSKPKLYPKQGGSSRRQAAPQSDEVDLDSDIPY